LSDYLEARELLLAHGSAKKALEQLSKKHEPGRIT